MNSEVGVQTRGTYFRNTTAKYPQNNCGLFGFLPDFLPNMLTESSSSGFNDLLATKVATGGSISRRNKKHTPSLIKKRKRTIRFRCNQKNVLFCKIVLVLEILTYLSRPCKMG